MVCSFGGDCHGGLIRALPNFYGSVVEKTLSGPPTVAFTM
jgi:hypothetical protein